MIKFWEKGRTGQNVLASKKCPHSVKLKTYSSPHNVTFTGTHIHKPLHTWTITHDLPLTGSQTWLSGLLFLAVRLTVLAIGRSLIQNFMYFVCLPECLHEVSALKLWGDQRCKPSPTECVSGVLRHTVEPKAAGTVMSQDHRRTTKSNRNCEIMRQQPWKKVNSRCQQ